MSWYDDDDGPCNVDTLAGILKRVYDGNHRSFNRDVESAEGRKYLHAIIHILTAFDLNIGYNYKWYGFPYSSNAWSSWNEAYREYTRKLRDPPQLEIHPSVAKNFDQYLAFVGEAGDDPAYLMLISGIVHVRRCYGYTDSASIRETLARGMNPTGRYDEAVALCRKYGLVI